MSEKTIKNAIEKYEQNYRLYEDLTTKVESVIKEILDLKGINYSDVTSRTKKITEYARKAQKEKYSDPEKEICDMSGVRIILYTNSDVKKTWDIIQDSFHIIPEHTIDKSIELGVDKMGYRSLHCVAMFDDKRSKLPEFERFKNLVFEIQIRTILQHAWAEFEHDRNYKFSGILPNPIKRKLSILAGMLELTDNEFDKISDEIDAYIKDVSEKTEKGVFDINITTISLADYLANKFKPLIDKNKIIKRMDSEIVIRQLSLMGITSIKTIDDSLPYTYLDIFSKLSDAKKSQEYNYQTLLIHLMWMIDANKYFSTIWDNNYSIGLFKEYINIFNNMNVDLLYILQNNNVNHFFVDGG